MNTTKPPTVKVFIPGCGEVVATVLQRYPDGDIRVDCQGQQHIVSPINQIKEY